MQDAITQSPAAAAEDPLDASTAAGTAIRGSALRSAGYAVSALLGLVSAPLLVRHLGIDDFGVYVTISALVTIVAGVSDLGLTSLGVREWAQRGQEERAELIRDLLGARLAFTLIGIVGAMAFALAAGYDTRRLGGAGLASIALLLLGLQSALTVPLAGHLRQGRIAAADLVRQVVQVAAIVVLVAAGAGLVPLLAAAIPAALASLLFTAAATREAMVRPALHPRRWMALLRGTLPFAAASAVSVVYLRTTVIVTSLVASAAQSGQFAIAFRVLEVLINVPALLIGALFPLLARAAVGDAVRLRGIVEQTLKGAIGIGALAAVIVATGAPIAVLLLSGHRASGAVEGLRILGVALGLSFIGATCQYALLALRAHRAILCINLGALTVNLGLTLVLAQADGAIGASVALACSELAVALSSSWLLVREVGELHLGSRTVRAVLLTLASGALASALLAPVDVVLAAAVAPALATAVALRAGALPPDLLSVLRVRGRST